MGNILSGEEKISQQQREKIGYQNPHRIVWVDEQLRYYSNGDLTNSKSGRQYRNKRISSFYRKNERNNVLRSKSQSLDAIIEELYLSGTENSQEYEDDFNFGIKKSLIPRIKLTRSVSSLRNEKLFKPLHKMSTQPDILLAANSANSSQNTCLKEKDENLGYDMIRDDSCLHINGTDEYDAMSKKSDENYFTKNFDECMKRLHLIEKEHELIEKDDADIQLYFLRENSKSQQDTPTDGKHLMEEVHSCETANFQNPANNLEEISFEMGAESRNSGDRKSLENLKEHIDTTPPETEDVYDTPTEDFDMEAKRNQEVISKWYSNLKQQFERPEHESDDQKTKEMTCRITGATLKNVAETHKPENKEKDTRHYFSRLIKSNKSLIDEELPDPDKVKNIRAMFQENLNSTLKKNLDKKLGGSLQNISIRTTEQQMARPLSAQCNRDELMTEVNKFEENRQTKTSELKEPDKNFNIEVTKRKLFEKYEKDGKTVRDLRNRRSLQPRWTDSGSVSSGVSSDLSSYDTDLESYSREGLEQEPDDVTISDDDLLEEVKDKHYVQNEILEKIRSFGTSVTYYGGEMITCSIGPLLSPTTQAIMEEISEKYKNESIGTRTFDEFYKKYVETNEPNRKKKLGRTRSFGQTDMFQKPNVLSNTEIEMYKNDLEIEIGIKKPTGIPQTGLKMKLTKSNSLGSRSEVTEAEETKFSVTPRITIDAAPEDAPIEEENSFSEQSINNEENECTEKENSEGNSNPEKREFVEGTNEVESENENFSRNEKENKSLEEELTKTTIKDISSEELKEENPEGLKNGKSTSENEVKSEYFEVPSKEILFGYEKSLINGKRKSDMEFEEFEVCETVTEKLEKLDEVNGSSSQSSVEPNNNIDVEKTTKVQENQDGLNEKIDVSTRRKWNINLNEETEVQNLKTETEDSSFVLSQHQRKPNQTGKYNQSKWPIETTVMIDIQKKNEQTPKIVTNGKTVAKTKIRLF